MYKKKDGTKITWKQFFKEWKEGIENITPVQKIKNDMRSTFTMLIGYVVGLVSLIVYIDKFVVRWFSIALIIIFLGAVWSNLIKWWVLRQQVRLFSSFDSSAIDLNKLMENLEEEVEVDLSGEVKKGMGDTAIKTEDFLDKEVKGGIEEDERNKRDK